MFFRILLPLLPLLGAAHLSVAQSPDFAWAKRIGAVQPQGYTGSGTELKGTAADAAGNVYVIGTFYGGVVLGETTLTNTDSSNPDTFLVKYDTSGKVLWVRHIRCALGEALALDTSGNPYLTSAIFGTSSFGNITLKETSADVVEMALAKFDQAGRVQWARKVTQTANSLSAPGLCIDKQDNVYLAGSFTGAGQVAGVAIHSGEALPDNTTPSTAYLAKLDATGRLQWVRQGRGASNSASAVAVDAAGNAYQTGLYSDKVAFGQTTLDTVYPENDNMFVGGTDIFLVKYAPDGTVQWAQKAGGQYDEQSPSVAVDATGQVLLAGLFMSRPLHIGGTRVLQNGESSDLFLARFAPTGRLLWARQTGEAHQEYSQGVALDGQGNAYVGGTTTEYRAAPPTLSSTASQPVVDPEIRHAFVVKYSPSGQRVWLRQTQSADRQQQVAAGFGVDQAGNAYLSGTFSGALTLGTTALVSSARYGEFFVAKLPVRVSSAATPKAKLK